MKKRRRLPVNLIVTTALLAVVLAAAVVGIGSANESRSEEAARVLEDSIRRAAVCCYAVEGMYPDTIEYLEENYGVFVDDAEFAVFYEVFATNIMPDVTVVKR